MKIQPYVYSLCLECSLCCISIVYIHIPTDCVSKKCILIHNFTLAKQTLKTVCSPEMSMSEWYLTLRLAQFSRAWLYRFMEVRNMNMHFYIYVICHVLYNWLFKHRRAPLHCIVKYQYLSWETMKWAELEYTDNKKGSLQWLPNNYYYLSR